MPRRAPGHAEAFVEQRAIHALDEAVGPRRAHPRRAVLDPFHREQQLVWMLLGLAAEFAAVVREDRPNWRAELPWKGSTRSYKSSHAVTGIFEETFANASEQKTSMTT